MFWEKLLFVLLAVVLIWWMIGYVRHNPGSLSMNNVNKSLTTLGILALILIGFIALLVYFLRH